VHKRYKKRAFTTGIENAKTERINIPNPFLPFVTTITYRSMSNTRPATPAMSAKSIKKYWHITLDGILFIQSNSTSGKKYIFIS